MDTESQPPKNLWIDKMSITEATQVMLNHQEQAIFSIQKSLPKINVVIKEIIKNLKKNNNGRLIYAGAGTSARIAIQDAVELYPTFAWPKNRIGFVIAGGEKAIIESVEGAEDDINQAKLLCKKINICNEDIVIALAASGTTPFTNECIKFSNSKKAMSIAISNNKDGKILKEADYGIVLETGYEIIAGSTRLKAATAQKICLNIISSMVMTKLGFVKNGLMTHFIPANRKLKARQKRFLRINKNIY